MPKRSWLRRTHSTARATSVAVGAMPDNPLLTTSYGYACCVK